MKMSGKQLQVEEVSIKLGVTRIQNEFGYALCIAKRFSHH